MNKGSDRGQPKGLSPMSSCLPESLFKFIDFSQSNTNVSCAVYQEFYRTECNNEANFQALTFVNGTAIPKNMTDNMLPLNRNDCLGCYIDHYCKYIAKMFEIQPKLEWWLQPRLFLYFLGVSGLTMAAIGFYIYAKLSDIYPYNLVATACLTEAAIYMRFMRMIVCPSQIFVILLYAFPIYGYKI